MGLALTTKNDHGRYIDTAIHEPTPIQFAGDEPPYSPERCGLLVRAWLLITTVAVIAASAGCIYFRLFH